MLAEKRRGHRAGSTDDTVSTRAGYIYTRYECLLTTRTAMDTTRKLEEKRRTNNLLNKRYAKELTAAQKYEARKRYRDGHPTHITNARAERLGVPLDLFPPLRSLRLRRAIADSTTAARRLKEAQS